MTDPLDDQIDAATRESRAQTNKALGLPPDYTATANANKAPLEELFEQYRHDRRCEHLRARSVQPAHWTALTGWMCKPCIVAAWGARQAIGPDVAVLGLVEESTCDRCRRYISSGLKSVIVRLDFWMMYLGCCRRCADVFHASGGAEITPGRPGS